MIFFFDYDKVLFHFLSHFFYTHTLLNRRSSKKSMISNIGVIPLPADKIVNRLNSLMVLNLKLPFAYDSCKS